jgi:hypothetical protein
MVRLLGLGISPSQGLYYLLLKRSTLMQPGVGHLPLVWSGKYYTDALDKHTAIKHNVFSARTHVSSSSLIHNQRRVLILDSDRGAQRKNTDICSLHASSWIRTHNPSARAIGNNMRLNPRCHCEARLLLQLLNYYFETSSTELNEKSRVKENELFLIPVDVIVCCISSFFGDPYCLRLQNKVIIQ